MKTNDITVGHRIFCWFLFTSIALSFVTSNTDAQQPPQYSTSFLTPQTIDPNVWVFYSRASQSGKAFWGYSTLLGLSSTPTDEGLWCAGSKTPNADPHDYNNGVTSYNYKDITCDANMDAIAQFNTYQALSTSSSPDLIARASNFMLTFDCFIPPPNTYNALQVYWLDNTNTKHTVATINAPTVGGWSTFGPYALTGFSASTFLYFEFTSTNKDVNTPANGVWIRNFKISSSVAPYIAKLFFDSSPSYNVALTVSPADINSNPTQSTAGFYRYYNAGTTIQLSAPPTNSSTGQFFKYWSLNGSQYSTTANTPFTVMTKDDRLTAQYSNIPITISNLSTDKTQYNLGEQPALTINLGNGFSGATVTYSINGTTPATCQNQGNGLYRATLPSSTTPVTFTATIVATADNYEPASAQLSYSFIQALSGHDMQVFSFLTSTSNVIPSNTIRLDGVAKNVGTVSSQVTVRFRLYDANNNVLKETNYTPTLGPGGAIEYTPTFATQSSWSGFYIAEMYVDYPYDINPVDNISRLSIYVGSDPPFSQYSLGTNLYLIAQNATSSIVGHSVKFILYGSNYANVQVDGGSTTKCIQNQLTLFSSDNFILIYDGIEYGTTAGFYAGTAPSTFYGVSNYTLVVDAGQTATYYFTSSAAPNSYQSICFGTDGSTVTNWHPSLAGVGGSNKNFNFNVPVPISATRKTYTFWPEFSGADGNNHLQILNVQVHEPHNISSVYLSPSNGTNITAGNTTTIKAAISNPGGYNEPVANAQISITGPNGYSYSTAYQLNISMGTVDTIVYSWNPSGLALGIYSISVSGIVTNDGYPSDNTLTSTINLIAPPVPAPPDLVLPLDLSINTPISPTFSWNSVSTASSYRIQIALENQFTTPVVDTSLVINQYTPTNLAAGTTYFWRVFSDNLGGYGTASTVRQFTPIPLPPSIPSLIAPSPGAHGQLLPICFKWNSLSGAQKYCLQVATDTLFTAPSFESDTIQTSFDTVATLSSGSTYYWRVRGWNAGGLGNWSQQQSFATALGSVLLTSPGNGSVGNLMTPILRWTIVPAAISYRVQISTDSLFQHIVKDSSNTRSTSQSIMSLLPSTKYFWRANATDGTVTNSWSTISYFTTGMPASISFVQSLINIGALTLSRWKDTTVVVTNTGQDTLKIMSISSSKTFVTVRPSSLVIPPSQSKNDTIRFTADSLGIRSGKIFFVSNDPSGPDTINVTGTVYGTPVYAVSRTSVNLGNVILNTQKADTVTIWNKGSDTLKITSITSTNGLYSATPTVKNIPPNGFLVDTIKFVPTTIGPSSAKLLIASNDASTPDTINVSGTSPVPILTSLKTSIAYGNVAKNTTKKDTIKVVNSSINTLTVDSIYTKTSAFAVDRISGTAGTDTLKVVVSFTPTAIASYTDTVYLRNNSATPLVKIPLSGNSPAPVLSASATSLAFSNRAKGDSATMMAYLRNTSISAMTISGITTNTTAFTATSGSTTVAGGDSTVLTVKFKPTSFGTFTDTVKVVSDGGTVTVVLSGASPMPILTSLKTSIAYGNVAKSTTKKDTIKVVNSSINTLIVDSIYTKTTVFTSDKKSGVVSADTLFLNVTFSPTTTGSFTDTLYLKNNSLTALVKIPLSGSTPVPVLAVSDTLIQFGDKAKDDSVSRVISIINKSISPLTISSISFGTTAFMVDTATVKSGANLALGKKITNALVYNDGETRTASISYSNGKSPTAEFVLPTVVIDTFKVRLWFKPNRFGSFTDTLSIVSDGGSKKVQVSGNSPYPLFALLPNVYRKDTVAVGDSSSQVFVIKNTSINDLPYDSASTKTVPFVIKGARKGLIKSSDSTLLTILFKPDGFGEYADTLSVISLGKTTKMPLSGSSPYPQMVLSVSSFDFGNVRKDTSAKKNIVVKNTSINELRIDSLKTKSTQFTVDKFASPVIVTKKDSAVFVVTFKPDTVKTYSDTLSIFSNQQTSVVYIALTGNGKLTSVAFNDELLPTVYELNQNFPNPFNPSTTLRYGIPMTCRVRLQIYNVLGQVVAELVDGEQAAGWYRIRWNADVSTGIYFYRIDAVSTSDPNNRFVQVKKMLLLK